MRIAVVSDTHGKSEPTQKALDQIRTRDVEAILHCGDIGSLDLIDLFADWPAHFVFGNVDDNRDALARKIQAAGKSCHGSFGELELAEKRIAFLHGDDRVRLREAIDSEDYDLVCYGHTHQKETHAEGKTVVLNAGALFRARPRTFALVELPSLNIEFVEVG